MRMCRVFAMLACFSLLVLPSVKSTSFAACLPPVNIVGYSYSPTSIQDAYDYASGTLGLTDFTLQLSGEILTENLLLNAGNVVIDGGYDCSFATKTPVSSGLFGTITIGGTGSVTFAGDVGVVSTDQCAFDIDGDGYTSIGSCSGTADDCNDNNLNVNPGIVEMCDGLDNNCDGMVDEGVLFIDADGDGYFAAGSCGSSSYTDDCQDLNADIHPGAYDAPYDGLDQDCSGADLTFAAEYGGVDCSWCHSYEASWEGHHDAVPAPDISCATCHPGNMGNILSSHYGDTVLSDGNNMTAGQTIDCTSCHDMDDVTRHQSGYPIGAATNFVWSKVEPTPVETRAAVTCDTCHETRAAVHANTGMAHDNRALSGCGGGACHTSDTAVLGEPGTGTLSNSADVDMLHRSDCELCHNYTGLVMNAAVVRQAVKQGVGGNTVYCLDCHTDKAVGHVPEHVHSYAEGSGDLSYEAPGQLCSNCHLVSTIVEIDAQHDVDTNGAGSCETCHNSSRQEVLDAITLAANPTYCLDCHSDKNLTVHDPDHVAYTYVTGGTTYCLNCHDTGVPADGTVITTHQDNCSLCHTTIPALQPGIPTGGGDCITCHASTWETLHNTNPPSHTSLVQVATTDCANCHDNTLESAATDTHNGCNSCHDANGALISTATGQNFTTGGDCTTCHTSIWGTIHTAAPSHATIVTVTSTTCGSCHDDTLVSIAAITHNDCNSCHDPNTGALTGSAIGQTGPGNCVTCHTDTWEVTHEVSPPDHSPLVQVATSDCANCHNNTLTSVDPDTHNDCSSCHDVNGVLISSAIGKDFTTGGECATCHIGIWDALHTTVPDHATLVTVATTSCASCHDDTLVGVQAHADCVSCHNGTTGALLSSAIGKDFITGGDCTTCHGAVWGAAHPTAPDHSALVTTTGSDNCAGCHENALTGATATTHLEDCSNCHSSADGSLVTTLGTDTRTFSVGGNCSTCHTDTWETTHTTNVPSHNNLVQVAATFCGNCHSDPPPLTAAGDPKVHNVCGSCHATNGSRISSAVGKDFTTGGTCVTCHTDTWDVLHTTANTPDHSPLVTVSGTPCALCHLDPPPLINAVDPKVHNTCDSCHDVDGARLSSASGKTFAVGGNCTSCHESSWEVTHTASLPSHNSLVTVVGTGSTGTGCGNCHSDPPPLTNAGDVLVHNTCGSCHDINGDSILSAIGKTFGVGGDCATCHTTGFATIHGAHTHTVAEGAGDLSHDAPGQLCSVCHVVSSWAEIEGTEHNVPTNGAGSCATCHNSPRQEVIDAIALGANPTNCLPCHSNKSFAVHGSADHDSLGYVTVGATPCLSCHDPGGNANETVTLIHNSNCALCHGAIPAVLPGLPANGGDCVACHTDTWELLHTTNTPDHTPLVTVVGTGTTGTGCGNCHSDPPPLIDGADAKVHNTCGSCHDVDGGLTSSAVGKTFGVGGDCATCHNTGYDSLHSAHSHTVAEGAGDLSFEAPGQLCSNCHAASSWLEIEATTHNVATNGAGSCATCHNSPRQEVIDTIALGANPTNCLPCHTNKNLTVHLAADHVGLGYVTGGATPCLSCHDPGAGANLTVTVTHMSNCDLCHTAILPGLLPGIPVGGGDCVACHTDTWTVTHTTNTPVHTSLVTVTGTTCGVCHADPPPLVNPGNPRIHNTCGSCHDAAGGRINSAAGKDFTTGGNCATCHTDTWTATHTASTPDHTPLVTISGTGTTGTGCGNCHSDPPPLIDGADALVHNTCGSCHDANGATINSAAGQTFVSGGDCATCHDTGYDSIHSAHVHTVAQGAGDLSFDAPGQLCSECHPALSWLEIEGTTHNVATNGAGSCATCHNSPRQEVIDTIALGANPTNCLPCHTNKDLTVHLAADHVGLGYVTVGATPCLNCHDPGAGANLTVTVTHMSNCDLCHTATLPGLLPGIPVGGGDCLTCHTDTWDVLHTTANTPDHTPLVTVTGTQCSVCHNDPLPLVNAGDPKVHNTCGSCHDSGGALVSSATGKDFTTGGNCSTCHTDTWEVTHTASTPSHNNLVQVAATTCGNCHSDPPPLINAGDPKVHDTCGSCHDVDGIRTSSASGKTFAVGGDCTTCHESSWELTHSTSIPSHNALVTISGTGTTGTGCGTCHSDPPPLINAGDAKVHNTCGSCHDVNGGRISSAAGETFAGGGDCVTCHTTGYDSIHSAHTHTVSEGAGDLSYNAPGQLCSVCHVVSTWAEIEGTEHNVATNGAGSCATCHNSPRAEVITAIATGASPTNCLDCHSDKSLTVHGNTDHVALGYVLGGATPCLNCHDTGVAVNGTVITTHLNDCALCHTTIPNLQPGIPTGGGICTACHTDTWGALHITNPPDHSNLVSTVGTDNCASCHENALTGATVTTHLEDCSNCHSAADGSLVTTYGTNTQTFLAGGNCSTCHTSGWEAGHTPVLPAHTALVQVGVSDCSNCHDDTLYSGAPETHTGCVNCHNTNGSLVTTYGTDTQDFGTGGDCTSCHGAVWGAAHPSAPDHSNLVTTTGTDNCATCHTDALIDATTHLADCSNCHSTSNGALVATNGTNLQTFLAGGNCATCHSTGWESVHTPVTPVHTTLVTVAATSCASCHNDTPLTSGDLDTHNACTSCHNSNGSLVTTNGTNNQDFTTGGDCATCHGSVWDTLHAGHSHTVSLGAGDESASTSCGSCHVVANWAEINGTEHNVATNGAGSCATCHNSPRAEVVTAITTGANPTNCLDCHSDKTAAHGSVDHVAAGYVTGGSTQCIGCHSTGDPVNGTVITTHLDDCALCHTTVPALQPGVPAGGGDCETCHSTGFNSIHAASCANCHGNGVDEYWPQLNSTDEADYPNRLGGHDEHVISIADAINGGGLNSGTTAEMNASCVYCHPGGGHTGDELAVPADTYQDGQPGNSDADDKFIYVLDDAAFPGPAGTRNFAIDTDGSFKPFNAADPTNPIENYGSCSNIDCHANAPFTPQWYGDFVKPGGVTSLTASTHNTSGTHVAGETDDPGTVYLTWNAPGDDGVLDGTAYRYEVRYSTSSINETNFTSATLAPNPPTVLRKGEAQEMVVERLTPGTDYYFAVRTYDETYLAGEAQNVSDVVATSTAVAAHLDDVKPVFWGLDKTEGHDSEGVVNLSWGAAKDHTLPLTYRVWWSSYSLKTHLDRGGTLPSTQTSYTEDTGGGAPTEGGSDYTIYTDSTAALAYQVTNLAPGILYNFVVHAVDGSPALNTDDNCICGLALVNTPPKEADATKLYSLSGSNSMVVQADPANPNWGLVTAGSTTLAGTSSVTLTAGTDLDDDVHGSSLSRDFWAQGVSVDLYVKNNDRKYPQNFSVQLGYNNGSFNSLGTPVEVGLGRRAERIMKISLSTFKGVVPANANLAVVVSRVDNTVSSDDITFGWGSDADKGQILVNAQPINHPPTAASGISATRTTGGYVDISWTPSGDGESSIAQTLHYDVYGSADDGATYPYVIGTGFTDADAVAGIVWDTVGDGLTGTSYTGKVKIEASDSYMYEESSVGSGVSSPGSGIWGSHVSATSGSIALNNSSDEEAPAPVTFSSVETRPKKGTVYLEWLAVGNDGYNHGTRASYYDIRYSPTASPITDEASYSTADQAWGEPAPNFAGYQDRFELVGLVPDTDYTIAIKACDDGEDTIKGNGDDNCSSLGAGSIVTGKGGQKDCGICHSTPPDDPATGGSHLAHGYTLDDCAKCHGAAVTSYTSRHYDGLVQIGWAENSDGSRAPLAELTAGSGGSGVIVTQTTDNNGNVTIYNDPDGAGGFNAAVTYNPGAPLQNTDSGSCMNFVGANANGCHGPFDPKWASDTVAVRAEPTCADCHGDKTAARNTDPYGRIWDDVDESNVPSDQVKAAPPQANHAGTETTDRYVGAHERHLNASFRFAKEDSCRLCHKDTFKTGLHANKSNDIVFDIAANESETVLAVADANLPDVDIKGISCSSLNNLYCHDTGARWAEPGAKCESCHGMSAMPSIPHISDGGTDQECNYCHMEGHPQSPDGVNPGDSAAILINNNPAVGIKYRSGGIHMRLVIGGRTHMNSGEPIDTLAEMCWGCHEDQNPVISEWGSNNAAMTGSSPYDYGSLNQSSWVGAIWTSAKPEFAYKTGYIQSIHSTDPSGTSVVTWDAANGRYNETADSADKIRCSNCHDVHDLNRAPGDTMTGRPYLRGTWMGNPYEEDGAPWNKTYTSENVFGAVPRGSTAYDELGGYYIDQNNVTPGTTTPNHYPTSGWTVESSAGLCTLCHGTDVDSMDQLTGENLWLGSNGHSNSALGGTFTNAANIFDYSHGRPAPVGYDWGRSRPNNTNHYPTQVPDTAYMYQGENFLAGGGYRGPDSNAGGYNPPLTDGQPYAFNFYDWGATSDADTTDVMYHQFSCSKCHNPHASRLPKLMITNCLDIRHNTWDENNSSQQNTFTASALTDVDSGKYAAYYASAQNCHRYDDSRSTEQLKGGWNKVTPWEKENVNNTTHP